MRIKQRIKNLIRKFKTRDPYEIAERLGINIRFICIENPEVDGLYLKCLGKKFFIINAALDPHKRKQVCAHELGHFILHRSAGWYYISANTPLSPQNKLERQANKFAWLLLFDEQECKEWFDGDMAQYSIEYGIRELTRYAE